MTFRRLPDSRVRLKYVRKLEHHSAAFADALASSENRWPQGSPPNFGDLASTELAKLDGRWWGTD